MKFLLEDLSSRAHGHRPFSYLARVQRRLLCFIKNRLSGSKLGVNAAVSCFPYQPWHTSPETLLSSASYQLCNKLSSHPAPDVSRLGALSCVPWKLLSTSRPHAPPFVKGASRFHQSLPRANLSSTKSYIMSLAFGWHHYQFPFQN